jgi:hypothetical protein
MIRNGKPTGLFLRLILTALLLPWNAGFAQAPPRDLVQRVDNAQYSRETELVGYRVTEHYYVLRNGNPQPVADAVVQTVYKRGEGKEFNIISRSGSSFLQNNLIDRVLREEKNISKGDLRKSVLVTSANYIMEFVREEQSAGRDCFVLNLTPKRKSPYLVNGQVWIDTHTYDIVHIEGRPSAAPSMWVGLPMIRRDYRQLEGFSMATEARSESKNFLFGTTVLKIDYGNYQITPDQKGVAESKQEGVAPSK